MTESSSSGKFRADVIRLLRETDEVHIQTRAAPRAPQHTTTIWVVVDDDDRVLIRTYRGPGSRWYREALGHASCALDVAGLHLDVVAERAGDRDRVVACSTALARKYADDPATPRMLSSENESTTLELHPA